MAIMNILTYPDNFLRKTAKQVQLIDDTVHKIIKDMAQTMRDASGTGLAATQIGIDKSIMIYNIPSQDSEQKYEPLINPKILSSKCPKIFENEGCLSIPDFRADVKRATSVIVEGLNKEGQMINIEAEGLLAVVFQHEIDHLNGILFIDRLSPLKRDFYKKRLKKKMRNEEKI